MGLPCGSPRRNPTPGPGDYAPASTPRSRGASWSFKSGARPKKGGALVPPQVEEQPGPDTYDAVNPTQVRRNPGSRFDTPDCSMSQSHYPGPGEYDSIQSWEGTHCSRSAACSPFGVRTYEYSKKPPIPTFHSPGPAHYDNCSERRIQLSDSPHAHGAGVAFGFATRTRCTDAPSHGFPAMPRFVDKASGIDNFPLPGPGSYDPGKLSYNAGTAGTSPQKSVTPRRWHNSHLNPRETPRLLQENPWVGCESPRSCK